MVANSQNVILVGEEETGLGQGEDDEDDDNDEEEENLETGEVLVTGGVTLTGEEVAGMEEAQEEEEEEEEEEEDLLSQAMGNEEKFMCGVSDWLGPLAVKRCSCVCVWVGGERGWLTGWYLHAMKNSSLGVGGGCLAVSICNEEKFMYMCVCVCVGGGGGGCLAVSICNEEKFMCMCVCVGGGGCLAVSTCMSGCIHLQWREVHVYVCCGGGGGGMSGCIHLQWREVHVYVCWGGGGCLAVSICSEEKFMCVWREVWGGGGGDVWLYLLGGGGDAWLYPFAMKRSSCVCVLREEGCLAVSFCNEEKFVWGGMGGQGWWGWWCLAVSTCNE